MAARNRAAASARALAAQPAPSTSTPRADPDQAEADASHDFLIKILGEKEQDLELAARIGNSLLEQNKELQERNEFLEESLATSSDAIQQLRHQLRQRSDLLEAYSEYDEQMQSGSPENRFQPGFVERLQNRVKELEDENHHLKAETSRLQDANVELEERNESRVRDYLSQLERANFKVGRLQKQLTEKHQECAHQDDKIRQLMRDIAARKKRERQLEGEGLDLREELADAIRHQDELRLEVEQLQERYVEVAGILSETKEELSELRNHHSGSWGSLYDSLASELEASDSGFYTTPMVSARSDSQQSGHSANDSFPSTSLQQELERLRQQDEPIQEHPCASCAASLVLDEHELQDVGRLETGCQTSARAHCSVGTGVEPSTSSSNSNNNNNNGSNYPAPYERSEGSSDDLSYYDMPNKTILSAVRRSLSAEKRRRRSPNVAAMAAEAEERRQRPAQLQLCTHPPIGYLEPVAETPLAEPAPKMFRTVSCSPIVFEGPRLLEGAEECPPDEPTPRTAAATTTAPRPYAAFAAADSTASSTQSPTSTSSEEDELEEEEEEEEQEQHEEDEPRLQQQQHRPPPLASPEDVSPRTKFLLNDYNGPKLGEPGRPGTLDLEFSLKRMDVRRKIERDYELFRQRRGLAPVSALFGANSGKPLCGGAAAAQLGALADRVLPVEVVGAAHAAAADQSAQRGAPAQPDRLLAPNHNNNNNNSVGGSARASRHATPQRQLRPRAGLRAAGLLVGADAVGERPTPPRPVFRSTSFGWSMLPQLATKALGIGAAVRNDASGVMSRSESQSSLRRRAPSPDAPQRWARARSPDGTPRALDLLERLALSPAQGRRPLDLGDLLSRSARHFRQPGAAAAADLPKAGLVASAGLAHVFPATSAILGRNSLLRAANNK